MTGSPSIGLSYDEGANAKGRLTGLQDYSGTTSIAYDKNGEVSGITRKFDGLSIAASFGHTRGKLTSITYPSGRVVSYAYANGQLRVVKVNDADFITGIRQHPLGMVEGWTWTSGATYLRTRDQDGLVDGFTLGSATQILSYDGMNRLETITDSGNADYNQTFGHDLTGRVISYKGLDAKGKPSDQAYFYDLNGNRTTHRVNGADYTYGYTQGYNYLETVPGPTPRSWLLTGQYAITDGVNNFSLDAYGRMTGVTNAAGTTTYLLNWLNQRVTKVMPNGAKTHFVYGASGELLAELDKTGQTLKEYIWLPTEVDGYPTLVGVSTGVNGPVNQVYTDQLGTPRLVTAPNGDVLWRWVSDPFGGGAPIETGLKLNLRFAGQYFDQEHGYHYNWNRYYDPATGRYAQSDPIGISGGLNTYAYVGNSAMHEVDPTGLQRMRAVPPGSQFTIEQIRSLPEVYRLEGLIREIQPGFRYQTISQAGPNSFGYSDVQNLVTTYRNLLQSQNRGVCSRSWDGYVRWARREGVIRGWEDETALVSETGEGTRNWSTREMQQLARDGKVSGYFGHHINNVAASPELASNPNNIIFFRLGSIRNTGLYLIKMSLF